MLSVNCLESMVLIEFCRPKAETMSAVQPITPKTAMIKRFLFLKTLRNVTFVVKLSLFQRAGNFSRKILFPPLGAFGLIRDDALV